MNEAVLINPWVSSSLADKALRGAATTWFLAAVIGQWIFVYYVAAFYGGAAVQGDF